MPATRWPRPLVLSILLLVAAPTARAARDDMPDARDLSPHFGPPPIEELLFRRPEPEAPGLAPPAGDVELGGANESSVAVNPLDPMNVAYASLWELRVSTDGGATFQPPVPLITPDTHFPAGDPTVAFDSQGRLFWSFIGLYGTVLASQGYDLYVARCDPATGAVLPGYPVDVTGPLGLGGGTGHSNDKSHLTADTWPASPFRDRLYLAWTDFPSGGGTVPYCTYSSDQGMTWAPAVALPTDTSFKWPVRVAVAPNGDLYLSDHRQFFSGGVPNGTSGRIVVFRSTDGGATFPQTGVAAPNGTADITFNRQDLSAGQIPGARFITQGSAQASVLPDPLVPGRVYVVFADDPDNNHNVGDASNVYIVRSDDHGATWSASERVDSGPDGTFQLFPTAAIDPATGNLAVTWYDNRSGATNADGSYLLDLYGAVRVDPDSAFGNDFRISDAAFDPDAGAPCRYACAAPVTGVWAHSPTLALACVSSGAGQVLRSDGTTWSLESNGGGQVAFDVWGSGPGHVWTVGGAGEIRVFDGFSWGASASGTALDLYRIHGASDTDVFAVGGGGIILHWDGVSWTPQASGTAEILFGVHALPGGTAWAVGFHGTVLHYSGLSWSPVASGTTTNLMGLWAFADDDVWVSGVDGTMRHWDGGAWTVMDSGSTFLTGIWGTSGANLYVGAIAGLLHWNGASFEPQSFSEAQVINLSGTSSSDILAVGTLASIGRFDGTSWTAEPNPGEAPNPSLRIGEYTGLAADVVGVVTWTGNTLDASLQPVDQQSYFDAFSLPWQVGTPELTPLASLLLLEPGRPNPFRWVTRVAYSLPSSAPVRVAVHDAAGRLVSELDAGQRAEGPHEVTWDGRDAEGRTAAAGVYFLRLEAGGLSRVRKLVLVR